MSFTSPHLSLRAPNILSGDNVLFENLCNLCILILHLSCRTFGGAADELLRPKHVENLAMFLCSGFNQTDRQSKMDMLNPWGESFLPDSNARCKAFMNFASIRLPELAVAATFAEKHEYNSQQPFDHHLRSICSCKGCSRGLTSGEKLFCLHRIGTTIFKYLWTLSWIDIEPSVKPSPSGLLMLYNTRAYGDEDPDLIKSHFWQYGLDTSLFSLFTGMACDERTTEGVSAIAHNGICIYYSSLQNPNVSPAHLLRLRVVLGQIEKGGVLYRKIRDRSFARNEAKSYSSLPLSVRKLGPKTQLLLVADETLDSKSLEVSFYIDSKPVVISSEGRFSQSHVLLDPEDASGTLSKEMFGICELRNKTIKQMAFQTRCQSIFRVGWEGSTTGCTGHFTKATQALFKDLDENILASLPMQGEWTISSTFRGNNTVGIHEACCISILRGYFPLLYSVLCYVDTTSIATLLYVKPCFICSVTRHEFVGNVINSPGQLYSVSPYSGPISVYSMKEPNPVIFEFFAGVIDLPTEPSKTSENLPLPRNYNNKTKKELEILFRDRGLQFKRASKKNALVRQLKRSDDQKRSADVASEMRESSQEERPDVEMGEDD